MTKTLKFLLPSLLVAGFVVVPTDAQATRDTPAFKENKFQAFKENKFKEPKKVRAAERIAPSAGFGDDAGFWTGGESKNVPELSSSAAGASLALLAGGLLAISGRRRRQAGPK